MKYAIKKQSRKKVSPVVLRAIARINDYERIEEQIIQMFGIKNQLIIHHLPRE